MKKLLLILALLAVTLSGAEAAAGHTIKEAGIRFETLPAWDKTASQSKAAGNNPGWRVDLTRSAPSGKDALVAILVIDGRNDPGFQQMTDGFRGQDLKNLTEQIIQDETVKQSQEGYQITDYRIKKANKSNFLIIVSENPRQKTVLLQALTFRNNYSYTIATKLSANYSPEEIKTARENFELIVATLQPLIK